jgi:hemerythrin
MMEWKPGYDIGVDFIDKQHRQLVEIISRLEASLATDAENKEMGGALKFLVDYTHQHFSEEEEFMLKTGFPRYEKQKALHKDFIQQVIEVLLKLKRGESIRPREFIKFLTDWLVNHILDEDKKIAEFVAEQKINLTTKETAFQEEGETEITKKLQKLKALYEKKLISGEDFKAKKSEYLTKYSEGETAKDITAVRHIFVFLGSLKKDHLLTKEEEKEYKAIIINKIDLEPFLETIPDIEEKLLYLKSLFEDGFMAAEVYESHKSKLLMDI